MLVWCWCRDLDGPRRTNRVGSPDCWLAPKSKWCASRSRLIAKRLPSNKLGGPAVSGDASPSLSRVSLAVGAASNEIAPHDRGKPAPKVDWDKERSTKSRHPVDAMPGLRRLDPAYALLTATAQGPESRPVSHGCCFTTDCHAGPQNRPNPNAPTSDAGFGPQSLSTGSSFVDYWLAKTSTSTGDPLRDDDFRPERRKGLRDQELFLHGTIACCCDEQRSHCWLPPSP